MKRIPYWAWWTFAILGMAALFGHVYYDTRLDDCVLDSGSSVVGTRLYYTDGLFSSSGPRYQLIWSGTKRRSGGTCKLWLNATESEYLEQKGAK